MNRKLILYTVLIFSLLISCSNYSQLKVIANLPNKLQENSGIISLQDSTFWVVQDNGNKDEIYKVNFKGDILKTLKVKNGDNDDWEDLAKDSLGNVYIADIGNNNNKRKNLTIYKIPNPEIEPGDKIDAKKIEFNYPEQKKFPPKKDALFYDAEALFHHKDKLFIITKNRSKPFTGDAFIYSVPDIPGKYKANFISKINLCSHWKTCKITGADISPKGNTIVALSYGKLFILTQFGWDDFSKGKIVEIDLGTRTQLESVCFLNDTTLLLSDERSNGTGQNLYTYTLKP